MNNFSKRASIALFLMAIISSCINDEDPGPLQSDEEFYSVVDFDRLEIGDAMNVTVEQGNFFSVHAKGDRRNLNDLEVFKNGNTLVIRFDEQGRRSYETKIKITLPLLRSVNFSGASNSTVSGFSLEDETFGLYLSGGSVSQIEGDFSDININVSGASVFTISGLGKEMHVELSGASLLNAFGFNVDNASVEASGASKAQVFVNESLIAEATGSSVVSYRGEPTVTSDTSGSSSVIRD
jgi:hypothetical protein